MAKNCLNNNNAALSLIIEGISVGIVVVGSIAFDTVQTPFGMSERCLGGAANYFSMAAKFFNRVSIVGVVGEDFPKNHLDYLNSQNVDVSGIEIQKGRSFYWQGEYGRDLSNAKTIKTELNVFEYFRPTLLPHIRDLSTVFLANIDPSVQIHVISQMNKPKVSALDTMNYWIEKKHDELIKVISMVDILFINDLEIRQLCNEQNVIKACRAVLKMGVKIVVVKRGEYGALLYFDGNFFFLPAYPIDNVLDPTGAGDAFAGGFLGYLSTKDKVDIHVLKDAIIYGTIMSSFVIERFSFNRLLEITKQDISSRRAELLKMIEHSI